MAKKMHTVSSVYDAGAGPNVTRKTFLELKWLGGVQASNQLALKCETSQKVLVFGKVMIRVRIGDVRVRVVFGYVRCLAVPILLGTH